MSNKNPVKLTPSQSVSEYVSTVQRIACRVCRGIVASILWRFIGQMVDILKIIAMTSSSGVSFAIHIIKIIVVADLQVLQPKSTKHQLCENSITIGTEGSVLT